MLDGTITRRPFIGVALLGLTGCFGQSTAVVFAPRLWIDEPANGAIVTSPVRVRFRVQSYEVRPAGDMTPYTGHHHLIIDRAPIAAGQQIPFDSNHQHLGLGQEEMTVELSPGPHTLHAQFADGLHRAIGGTMTVTIQVNVVTIG
jgi:hypothetical protein